MALGATSCVLQGDADGQEIEDKQDVHRVFLFSSGVKI